MAVKSFCSPPTVNGLKLFLSGDSSYPIPELKTLHESQKIFEV